MKIAYLSASGIPSRDANAVHVMKMCEAFARQGHAVTLYARCGDEPADDLFAYYGVGRCFEVVRLRRPGVGGFAGLVYGALVAWAVRRRELPDLLYARDSFSLGASAAFGRPMILESHVPPTHWLGSRVQAQIFRQRHFRRLVVVSRVLQRSYLRRFAWLRADRIRVVPVGGDAAPVGADAALRVPEAANGRWHGRSGCLQVGYAGQLYRGKGIEVIVELAGRLPEVDFHVVGGIPDDIARWQTASSQIANLRFHGHVPPSETPGFRQAMDVLLAPYQRRATGALRHRGVNLSTCPIKLFEYMGSRKPIVASRLPAVREILSDGASALLVPPTAVESWVLAIQMLQRDAGLRRRLAGQAWQDLNARWTWEQRARVVLDGADLG